MALVDNYTLSQDTTFRSRVRQAALQQAGVVAAESQATAFHERRTRLVSLVVADPGKYGDLFAEAIAGTNAINTAAGSPPNQANVTDAQINTAVANTWNAVAGAF